MAMTLPWPGWRWHVRPYPGLLIPYGHLSDRFGRKPVIAVGLLIFIVGSVVAALSTSLTGVIIGARPCRGRAPSPRP